MQIEDIWFIVEELVKHSVTPRQVLEVIQNFHSENYGLEPSEAGNERAMIVGRAHNGALMEVGIEDVEGQGYGYDTIVFHGMWIEETTKSVKLSGYDKKLRMGL